MVVGNDTCELVDQEVCDEIFALVKNNQSVRSASDYLTFPSAKKYVQRLFSEAPSALEPLQHEQRLAVVTGISKGSVGYYVAEELAGAANMDLVLVGDSFDTLEAAAAGISDEIKRRRHTNMYGALSEVSEQQWPKLHMVPMDTDSLRSVSETSKEIQTIASLYNQGQVHVLANLGAEVIEFYGRTKEGVEANMGCNYLAPRLLADLLLPQLRAAATREYKPRLIQEASVSHCLGADFDPYQFQKCPKEGGALPFRIARNEETQELEFGTNTAGLELFHRSKMALMADALELAREEPMLAVVSCDPGILSYATAPPNVTTGTRQSLSSRVLDLSPSQAARSVLRAALDPAFNDTDVHYLHSDGTPWRMAAPTLDDCCDLEEYAGMVRDVGDELSGQLLADQDCEWSAEDSCSSSLLGSLSPLSSPCASPLPLSSSMLDKDNLVSAVPAPPLATPSEPSLPSSQSSAVLQASTRVWGRAFASLLS